MEATLNEFEYRKWAAQQTYEERKALLEAEHADKETFVLLEKSLAAELDDIEKEKTQTTQEEAEKRTIILRTALEKMAAIERGHRGEVRSIALEAADIEKQLTMNKFDYERDKLNEKYAADLIAAEGNSEAMLQIIRTYQLQKEELDKKMATSFEEIFSAMAAVVGNFFTQLGNLSQARFNNELARLDEETLANREALTQQYEDEREAIENSLMSEAEKTTALLALEAKKKADMEKLETDTEQKKKAIQQQAFESQKKITLITAAINIAEAITKALTGGVPPWNIILAAITGAAGAVQIAAISAQEFPSAEKGAYLPSPTLIEAGHGTKGEVILPLDRAPAEFFKETTGGMNVELNFYAPLVSAISLSDRNMDEAAEYMLEKTKEQFERYGGKLNA